MFNGLDFLVFFVAPVLLLFAALGIWWFLFREPTHGVYVSRVDFDYDYNPNQKIGVALTGAQVAGEKIEVFLTEDPKLLDPRLYNQEGDR